MKLANKTVNIYHSASRRELYWILYQITGT